MGWSIGYDDTWQRDIGYGVPAYCDHPDCNAKIDRGLAYVCGDNPFGGDDGCGLYFCEKHLGYLCRRGHFYSPQICERCESGEDPFDPSPDHPEWITWKLTDDSWREWREENETIVHEMEALLAAI